MNYILSWLRMFPLRITTRKRLRALEWDAMEYRATLETCGHGTKNPYIDESGVINTEALRETLHF